MSIKSNSDIIRNAFMKASIKVYDSIRQGMESLLDFGVEMCLAEHDDDHRRHLEVGDSYGWMLLRNGVEVRRKLFAEGAEAEGNASRCLDDVKARLPQEGWVGVVLAGVEPATYFSVLYEFIPMRSAINDLKAEDFDKYFNKIQ